MIETAQTVEPEWHRKAMETREKRLAWWREARFGMFIHWGVYSTLSGEWQGKHYGGYAEHIQRKAKIPIATYRKEVAGKFNPTEFNADEWVRIAKEAGMGYLVITAKHHDGIAMYPSQVSDMNIAQDSPFQRDPMRELRDACRRQGVHFGFYYSHAFDWGDSEGPGNDWDYENPGGDRNLHGGREWWKESPHLVAQARRYVDRKSIPQIRELIARYDPEILWFDTPHKLPPEENLRILEAVRKAGPNVVVNGRLVRGRGDYVNTADRPAEFPPHDGDWEGIPTTNESYGYSRQDRSHKPVSHFIQLMAKAAARGGNLLMNIGPMGNGRIDAADVAILRGIGKWMATNGKSIRGTDRTPLPVQSWGESTRKGNILYLHVFDWPKEGHLTVGGLRSPIRKAYLLSDARRTPLRVERRNERDVVLAIPAVAPDAADSVIVLESEGDIQADASTRLLSPNRPNELRVFDAQLRGKMLRFGAGKMIDAYAHEWTRPEESIAWPLRLNDPAKYAVELVYDAEPDSEGGVYRLTVGTQTFMGRVAPGKIQKVLLGEVSLPPGGVTIELQPERIQGAELMRPRSVILTPIVVTKE